MDFPTSRIRLPALLLAVFVIVAPAALAPPDLGWVRAAHADGDDDGRKKAIKGLAKRLRKLTRDPRVASKHEEVHKLLDSLATLGGPEAGDAALDAAPINDEAIRDRAFGIAEENHDKSLVEPLVALLENKDLRRDSDIKKRVAHALQVMADESAIEPLAELIRYDEDDPEVVTEAANALATFPNAKLDKRKIAVKRMIDLYETTYNLMKSIRPEDRLQTKVAADKYREYGRPLRDALQVLTGQQLAQPKEWRRWWNDCKKSRDWKTCKSKAHAGD